MILRYLIRRVGFYLAASLLFMAAMLTIFSVFYHFTEGLGWLDSFYFTVITTRTIGFGDISPQTTLGKMGTIVNALLPATVFLGASLVVLETAMKQLENYWKRFRMNSNRNHDIIVADLELIESVVTEYELKGRPFVVIGAAAPDAMPPEIAARFNERNFLQGDASREDVLKQARIDAADSIIIATSDDSFNMYVLVTARSIAPGVRTVVRVNRRETESKFRSVGADLLLPAATVLGRMLCEAAVNPISHDFLLALQTDTVDPFIIETPAPAAAAGKPVRAAFPRSVAVFRNNRYLYNVENLTIEPADIILSVKTKLEINGK